MAKERFSGAVACRHLALVALVLLVACAEVAAPEAAPDRSARVEPVEGSKFKRVVLSERAAEQLGVRTTPVMAAFGSPGPERRVVPHGALLYDATGATIVYTQSAPLAFVGQSVVVESVQGDTVTLLEGPAPGTPVVSVGAAELFGIEFGVGK